MIANEKRDRSFSWRTLIVFFALSLVSGCYCLWRAGVDGGVFLKNPVGLYHELTDSFSKGKLEFLGSPDPDLLRLPNPYDPAANSAWRRNDLSLFRNRYYLYHSAVPVIALFLPLKLVSGRYLSEDSAVGIFCWLGTTAGIAALLVIRRAAFPKASLTLTTIVGITMVFGCGQFAVLRHATVNHVAIACAGCFLMLAFLAASKIFDSRSNIRAWSAFLGTFMALAIVSRPNMIYGAIGVAFLLSPQIGRVRSRIGEDRGFLSRCACVILPMLAIGGLAALYNYLRFGSITEFGARYMLGGWDQTHMDRISLAGVKENLLYYFFGPFVWSRYFPFLRGVTWRAVGVIPTLPYLGFAILLFTSGRMRPTAYFAFLFSVLSGNLFSLLFLPSGNEAVVLTSANSRYLPDFVIPFAFLSCVSILSTSNSIAENRILSRGFIFLLLPFSVWSIIASLSLDFEQLPETSYRLVASILDAPAALRERLLNEQYGPIDMNVRLPGGNNVSTPLLSSNSAFPEETLNFRTDGSGKGFFETVRKGFDPQEGDHFPLDYSKAHDVRIWMSSLIPPLGHPSNFRLSSDEYIVARHRTRVYFDGKIVFDRIDKLVDLTPRAILLGATRDASGKISERFQGSILSVRHLPIVAMEMLGPIYGDVVMGVIFPVGKSGTNEPLVVTGVTDAGDLVFVSYLGSSQLRFGFDHWGSRVSVSKILTVDFATPHTIAIGMDSLREDRSIERGLQVILDGKNVLSSSRPPFESSPDEVEIGINSIGGSSCGERFTGKMVSVARIKPALP